MHALSLAPRARHPLHSTPLHSTPLHSTPLHSTPLHSTPLHSTPLHSTPLHSTRLQVTRRPTSTAGKARSSPPASSRAWGGARWRRWPRPSTTRCCARWQGSATAWAATGAGSSATRQWTRSPRRAGGSKAGFRVKRREGKRHGDLPMAALLLASWHSSRAPPHPPPTQHTHTHTHASVHAGCLRSAPASSPSPPPTSTPSPCLPPGRCSPGAAMR